LFFRISLIEYSLIFKQIALGVSEVHKKDIVHRDIKAENLIINKNDLGVKLIDFGFSIRLDHKDDGNFLEV
jgi:serine/threonine protein kinase